MELREAKTLLLLAEEGSIARCAERLNLSPAAVFKQLKNLEQEWGIRLYEKRGRSLQLIQPAQIILPYLREMVHQGDAARIAIDEWKGLRSGVVRIGTGPTLASYVIPTLLLRFRKQNPKIDLHIQTGSTRSLLESLRAGALDVAVLVAGEEDEADVEVVMEWDFEIVLVSNLPEAPRRCALKSLQEFPFILYERGSRIETEIDRYLHRHRFHPQVIMRSDSAEAIKAMVTMGLGISMLPLWTIEAGLKQRKLQVIRQREQPLISRFALVTRKTAVAPGSVEAFIQVARKFEHNTSRWVYG